MKFLLAVLGLFLVSFGQGQPWQGRWISSSTDSLTTPNSWHSFRRDLRLSNVPNRAIARIATDTKYWLWVNDSLVTYEGGLKRGPNPRDTYYDEVNLTPYLKRGQNTVALLTWFWGGKGFSYHNSERMGLLFDCPAINLYSDATWKGRSHPAYGPSDLSRPNFRLSEPMVLYDARREMGNWQATGFNDRRWPSAVVVGQAGVAPWNELVKRPIPLFRDYGTRSYVSIRRSGDTLVGQLPYNAHVSPRLRVRAPAGKRILMLTDTYNLGVVSPTDSLYTIGATYLTKAGEQSYESLGWLTGREVRYVVPNGVEVLGVDYRETGYDTPFAGEFVCNDTLLTRLWRKAQRTLYLNMRDQFTDCPDRERAQWTGDGAMNSGMTFWAFDSAATPLVRKFYHELIGWQRPDSVLYGPVPETDWKQELPAQSLAALYHAGPYFHHTHDTATVRLVYPAMRRYLYLWKPDSTGRLNYRKGGWDWGDWGDNQDVQLIQHGWYVLALQTATQFARLLGQPAEAAAYEQRSQMITTYLNSPAVWNGQVYRSPAYAGSPDDRGNALLVLAGVADRRKWPFLIDLMRMATNASPFMEKFVLESLFRMEQPQAALDRMRWRYRAMVESPLSTLWELWYFQPDKARGNSGYNHAWAGGPLELLSAYIAGVRPGDTPVHFLISPKHTDLVHVQASVPTRQGALQVALKYLATGGQYSVRLPAGVSATVTVPTGTKAIFLNGKRVNTADTGIYLPSGFHQLEFSL